MAFKKELLDQNGAKESISDFGVVSFTEVLNGVGSFFIRVPSSSSYKFSKYVDYQKSNVNGNEQGLVYFTNDNGFLEFKGKVDVIRTDDSRNLIVEGSGTLDFARRLSLTDENRGSENNDTRVNYILSDATIGLDNFHPVTVGTVDVFGTALEPVYYERVPYFQALDEMTQLETDQDYFMSYNSTIGGNDTFEVRERAGSSSSVGNFIEGVNIRNVRVERRNKGIANVIKVVGAVKDGSLVSGSSSDPTSISKYGRIEEVVVNKKIETAAAATDYANAILSNRKNPRSFISFEVTNSSLQAEDPDTSPRSPGTFALGDSITVTSESNDFNDQSLRILSYNRVFFPDNTQKLFFNCISDGVRYNRGAVGTGGVERDGTEPATPGQNLSQGSHTPGQNFTQANGGGAVFDDSSDGTFGATSINSSPSWKPIKSLSPSNNWSFGIVNVSLVDNAVSGSGDQTVFARAGVGSSPFEVYHPNSSPGLPISLRGNSESEGACAGAILIANPADDDRDIVVELQSTSSTFTIGYAVSIQLIRPHGHSVSDKSNQPTSANFTDTSNKETSHPGSAG